MSAIHDPELTNISLTCPVKQPTSEEATIVAALLQIENNNYRQELGHPALQYGERVFSQEDLRRGRALCPEAFVNHDNAFVLRIPS